MGIIGFGALAKLLPILVVTALGLRVTTTTGESYEGELEKFAPQKLVVRIDGQLKELKYDELLSVERLEPSEKTGPTIEIGLLNGCKVRANEVSLKDDTVSFSPRKQSQISLPTKEVKSIRVRPGSVATDSQWLGLLANNERRDVLAIHRSGDKVDPAIVVIESIEGEKVGFNLDGQTAAAPFTRLEGVIFGGKAKVKENATILVRDIYHSAWAVTSLTTVDDQLAFKLNDTTTHKIPYEQIDSIRWSSGLLMLASEAPAKSSYEPHLKTNAQSVDLAKWFGPSVADEANIKMAGGSSVEYRIDGDFTKLSGSVKRIATVTKAGEVSLSIELDGKQVWNEAMAGTESRGFEIQLKNARRVRFVVDCGTDGDVGDTVLISRPRLLK